MTVEINENLLKIVLMELRNKKESKYVFTCLKDQVRTLKKVKAKNMVVEWLFELFSAFSEEFI